MLTRFRALSSGSCLHGLHFYGVIYWLRFSHSASCHPLISFDFFFSTFLFSLNNRSPSSGGDDPGIKQIKLFVLFLEGEDQRRNSDALPSLMGAMAELFIKITPMLYNAL